jgi:tetratricopeptide (TPR) repeat protein
MIKTILKIINSAILLFFFGVQGSELDAAQTEALMDSANNYLMAQDYHQAERFVNMVLAKQPERKEALYLKCVIKQTQMLDYESYSIYGENFIKFADTVFRELSYRLPYEKGKDSLQCMFYIGGTLGGIGIIQAKIGNWPFGVRNAMASVSFFKQIIKIDPEFKAAYLGIGIFNYYLSDNFKWLPFFGDKREVAIQQIRLATMAPFPFNFAACNSLCWILISRGLIKTADSVATQVLIKYPDNTTFLRIKVRTVLGDNHWEEAINLARKLIDLSKKRSPENWSDMLSGYQALLMSFDKLGRKKECLDTSAKVLALDIPGQFKKIQYVKKHLKYAAEIRKKYLSDKF